MRLNQFNKPMDASARYNKALKEEAFRESMRRLENKDWNPGHYITTQAFVYNKPHYMAFDFVWTFFMTFGLGLLIAWVCYLEDWVRDKEPWER
jgi:hypothetical protein